MTNDCPTSLKEIFENGECSYQFVDYSPEFNMDNIASMSWFIGWANIHDDDIENNEGTQITIKHPDYPHMLVIDSGGLGDFYSHGFDVSIHEE